MSESKSAVSHVRRRRAITAAILLFGLCSSTAVYLTAGEAPADPFADYHSSKRFSHDVLQAGGRMAQVADDLNAWFVSLWQGRQLAFSLAFLTVAAALAYCLAATGAHSEDTGPDETGRG